MACEHGCDSTTGVLEGLRCGTGPSSRVRARAPPVQHILYGGYKRGLQAFFQGKQRHHECSGAPEEENRGGGQGETTTGESALATSV